MVMTMGFLGREKKYRMFSFSIFHVLGATLGGALVGGLLGALGWLLSLTQWRIELVIAVACFALWQSLTLKPARLGLHRQVPRSWARTMVPELCYFLWGMELGSGVMIVIPYSVFFVLMSLQLTSGFLLGILCGALFGGIRQLVALLPLSHQECRLHPEKAALLKVVLAKPATFLNVAWIIAGTLLVVIAGWR